jgi:hypothetical protein
MIEQSFSEKFRNSEILISKILYIKDGDLKKLNYAPSNKNLFEIWK